MSETRPGTSAQRPEVTERLRKAAESLERLQKTISPYLKPRPIATRSTAGKWCLSGEPAEADR